MKPDTRLTGALQENILAALCFDKLHACTIRAAVTPQLFESAVFREIAGIAIDFIDQFREPVGDHLPDHLEHILKGEDSRKAAGYQRVVTDLFDNRGGINGEYVVSKVHEFVRMQTLKDGFIKAAEAFEDGRLSDAENELQKALSKKSIVYSPGINIADPKQALSFLDNIDAPFAWGVPALERFDVGPARKTLFALAGPLGKGKSWGLMQIGKFGLLQHLNVVHITLEMSEEQVVRRYMQMLFSVTRRAGGARVPRLAQSFDGGIKTIEFEDLDLPSMEDPDIREFLTDRIKRRLGRRAAFRVKKFPSGSLSVSALNAWLDDLERYEKIVPDLIVLDYAELMALSDPRDKRGSIGTLYVELRGISDERNCAMVTASQVNRPGIAKLITDEGDLSEDISKAFTADTLVTYNQTEMEMKLGMARLHVAKSRDGTGKMTALITQAYSMGQFCLDSVLMPDRYLPSLQGVRSTDREDDEDDRPVNRRTRSAGARR